MATFTVVNVADDGLGSLRAAIVKANENVGTDTIAFAIPSTGVQRISPRSALPEITDSVLIDGTTQGTSDKLLIEIDGTDAGVTARGLQLSKGSSTLRGLAINNFQLGGVLLASDGNVLEGNYVGISPNGLTRAPNLTDGIQITGSNNTIGGAGSGKGNIISGNSRNGISINGPSAAGNTVVGNTIGLDFSRTISVANGNAGVQIGSGAKSNNVGGTTAVSRNFISGNSGFGVLIEGTGSDSNIVQGNYIGNGTASATNLGNGVGVAILSGAKLNTVGTSTAGARNIISGNIGSGIQIRGVGTNDNQIVNNFVGLTDTGLAKLANREDGILVDTGAVNNTIGGTTSAHGNVISGNIKSGVNISGVGTNQTHLFFNTIGLNAAGTSALSNSQGGVIIKSGSASNEVGSFNKGNTISGNEIAGVRIQGASNNTLVANAIGTNLAKTASVPNSLDGVVLELGASNNVVGSATLGGANIISGNTRAGVRISGVGTNGNTIQANRIGTGTDSSVAIGNAIGVWITLGAKNNSVGVAGSGNTISGNTSFGVSISGPGTDNNVVRSNRIGTTDNGINGQGNLDGVNISAGAKNNVIGGALTADRNFINGNSRDGISLTGSNTIGNQIIGNNIGLGSNNLASTVQNARYGISVRSGANNNTIGSAAATSSTRNSIAGNGDSGIFIADLGSSAIILNNAIGLSTTNQMVSNLGNGISVGEGATAMIGGINANEGNIISGNFGSGVLVSGNRTTNVSIQGNIVGLDRTGTLARGNKTDGIRVTGSNVTIGSAGPIHNVISSNAADGIDLSGASNVTVKGNLIGTNSSGLAKLGNGNGLLISKATNVVVGGPTDLDRNIISGSIFDGVIIAYLNVTADPNVRLENNFIGLGINGSTIIPNKDGVQYAVTNVPITFTGNVVSGNTRMGIRAANTSNQVITGNKIGLKADGITPAPNGSHGIFIHEGSNHIRVGGSLDSDVNIIAHNGGDGILVGSDPALGFTGSAGSGNSLIRNLIFGNAGQAIDIGPNDGPTPNDLDDIDLGPNDGQNAPVITLATTLGESLFIRGLLNSLVGNYRIDFYSGSSAGQAQKHIGTVFDSIAGTVNMDLSQMLEANVELGSFVMAVVTNLDTGSSSELSTAVVVV